MSRDLLHRRGFLTLGVLLPAVLPAVTGWGRARPVWAAREDRRASYLVDVGILYDAFNFQLTGTVDEWVDHTTGHYEIRAAGRGRRLANRLEAEGRLRGGRWAPIRSASFVEVAGRQTRTEIQYDYERRTIDYHYRGETFFFRRQRTADDTVVIPPGVHVDDLSSAVLNFAEGRWPVGPDGLYRTHVVRRQRPEREGPDDVAGPYRAELAAVAFRTALDGETGRATALVDISGFTGWAREDRPARVVFGADRRPATVAASLILGTSVTIRLRSIA